MTRSDIELGFLLLVTVTLIVLYIYMLVSNLKSAKKVKQQIKRFKDDK